MKIVFLTAGGGPAEHMLAQLRQQHPVDVVRIHWPRPAPDRNPPVLVRLQRAPRALLSRVRTLPRKALSKRFGRDVAQALHGDGSPQLQAKLSIPAALLNTSEGARSLAALEPDLVLVHGAPILRGEILRVAKRAMINVHLGASPRYRGNHTLFWALWRRDYAHVGVTVHALDSVLDGGDVLARAYPELCATDGEVELTAKCARLAADLLIELVAALERGPVLGAPQNALGRAYRSNDRKLWHDAVYWLRRRRELLPPTAQRIERRWRAAALLPPRAADRPHGYIAQASESNR